jgi:hypothetical protein
VPAPRLSRPGLYVLVLVPADSCAAANRIYEAEGRLLGYAMARAPMLARLCVTCNCLPSDLNELLRASQQEAARRCVTLSPPPALSANQKCADGNGLARYSRQHIGGTATNPTASMLRRRHILMLSSLGRMPKEVLQLILTLWRGCGGHWNPEQHKQLLALAPVNRAQPPERPRRRR